MQRACRTAASAGPRWQLICLAASANVTVATVSARGICLRVSLSRCVCSLRVFVVLVFFVCRTCGMGQDGMGWECRIPMAACLHGRKCQHSTAVCVCCCPCSTILILVQASLGWCTPMLGCLHRLVCLYQIKLKSTQIKCAQPRTKLIHVLIKAHVKPQNAQQSPRIGTASSASPPLLWGGGG